MFFLMLDKLVNKLNYIVLNCVQEEYNNIKGSAGTLDLSGYNNSKRNICKRNPPNTVMHDGDSIIS